MRPTLWLELDKGLHLNDLDWVVYRDSVLKNFTMDWEEKENVAESNNEGVSLNSVL